MSECVYQHVITKGGEMYTRDMGVYDCDSRSAFDSYRYLTDRMQYERGMVQVEDDRYVSMDCIASIHYTRQEVH